MSDEKKTVLKITLQGDFSTADFEGKREMARSMFVQMAGSFEANPTEGVDPGAALALAERLERCSTLEELKRCMRKFNENVRDAMYRVATEPAEEALA